ncbi:uncharacterized protein LOC126341392 isoform X1 [Schistocerca gregaria]|uniref:uncharacterized protein LOC126341392 isoform X1 n=1 Tax=Schistocerca gregaria TaxID=7010 RepID=UPI00211F17EF|nr:uncharacterized protein LOC126341392 isoform X1 [Schistocerca gregaria]
MMTETTVTVSTQDAAPGHNANAQQQQQQQVPHVKTDPGQQGTPIFSLQRLNPNYFRTVPGIIKLVQLVLGIVCMACASPAVLSGTHWFLFVAAVSFTATLIWVFVYLLNIREALKLPINWILTELLNTALMTLLYLIAFIVQLAIWSEFHYSSWKSSNIAAGVFGLFNFLAYAAGVYFLFVEWKNSKSGN